MRKNRTARQQEVIDAYLLDPTAAYEDIGSQFDISGVRVRQIVTAAMRQDDPNWKKPIPPVIYTCKACLGVFEGAKSIRYCPDHRNQGYVDGEKAERSVRICLACGKEFSVPTVQIKAAVKRSERAGVYCSNTCRIRSMKERPIKKRAIR